MKRSTRLAQVIRLADRARPAPARRPGRGKSAILTFAVLSREQRGADT